MIDAPLAVEVLEAMPDAVVVVGADRTIAYVNKAAERTLGWSRDEAAGRFWGDVLALRDAAGFFIHEKADPFDKTLRITHAAPERELLLRRRDGEDVWVAVRASYERNGDGSIQRAVVAVRDIGRRKRLDKARSDLISTVSHEIRSPLTSVKGFTATLLNKWERFNDEQKRNMLAMMNSDADRVTRLLTELLDVARLEAGRLELKRQEIDLFQIATSVVGRVAANAEHHEIACTVPEGFPKVTADPGKIEQVLFNLVENAVKYGDPGTVTVSGEATDAEVIVRVADSGPGIEERHVPHLFTKFYRRGHGERRHGTGLGLYICKGIVEAHRGRIEVERSTPEGTVFLFALPREQA